MSHPAERLFPDSVMRGLIILPDVGATRAAVHQMERQKQRAWQATYRQRVKARRVPKPKNPEHEALKAMAKEWIASGPHRYGDLKKFTEAKGIDHLTFNMWVQRYREQKRKAALTTDVH